MPNQALHPRLREALRTVRVDLDTLTAHVRGAPVEADSPGALRHALANRLYEVLHAGLGWGDGPRPRTFRDPVFERLLAARVPHQETVLRVPAGSVAPGPGPEQRITDIDGVRTLVPADVLTPGPPGSDFVTLRYPAARPALSTGFFLVDGSAGPAGGRVVRCYLSVERAESAPGIWAHVLGLLEDRSVPYRAKVSSSPMLYPRHDAIVVYLDATEAAEPAGAAPEDLAAAATGLPGLGRTTSVFVRELAPGVGTAAEPADPRPGAGRMSFGQHRAHAVAEGVLEYAQASGSDSAPDVETAVCRALVRAGVRPEAPWRNSSDTDRATGPARTDQGANR